MEEGERNPAEFSDTHLSQGAEELEMCVCVWERERLNRERERILKILTLLDLQQGSCQFG